MAAARVRRVTDRATGRQVLDTRGEQGAGAPLEFETGMAMAPEVCALLSVWQAPHTWPDSRAWTLQYLKAAAV